MRQSRTNQKVAKYYSVLDDNSTSIYDRHGRCVDTTSNWMMEGESFADREARFTAQALKMAALNNQAAA